MDFDFHPRQTGFLTAAADWNFLPGREKKTTASWMGDSGAAEPPPLPAAAFNSWSSSSGLSSPLGGGSELGSTETDQESQDDDDDDDFIAQLTRQMADYMLQEEDEDEDHHHDNTTPNSVPQSQLLLNQKNPTTGFNYSAQNSILNDNQIKSIQFYEKKNRALLLKQQQQQQPKGSVSREKRENITKSTPKSSELKQQEKKTNKGGPTTAAAASGFGGYGGLLLHPPLEVGSGMRAIFLGGGGPDSRNGGTGVFLPRGMGTNPTDTRKKSRCSTVLIPAKVIHALQLHYNEMNALSRSNGPGAPPLHHHIINPNHKNNAGAVMTTKQKRWNPTDQPQPTVDQQQMGLPQEWTY